MTLFQSSNSENLKSSLASRVFEDQVVQGNGIFTPNIIITKSYEFINKFMAGFKLSDIGSDAINDTLVFLNKQNRYVYSLELSHSFGNSDIKLELKIVDVDGDLENNFLNETFYEKLIATRVDDYLKSTVPGNQFNNYFASVLNARLKLYVTFGVGEDLSNWADPIVCELVGADIDVANTGLRTYTYSFIPVRNILFTSAPKKDSDDPNINDSLNLGFANISITAKLDSSKIDEATFNVTNLLKQFCSKVTNTPEGNVIVILPDIDDAFTLFAKGTTLDSKNYNDSDTAKAYQRLFRYIEAEYAQGTTILQAKQIKLIDVKKAFSDYLSEQEKKDIEGAKERKNIAAGAKNTSQDKLEIAKELTKINREISQINEFLLQYVDEVRYGKQREQYKEKLKQLEDRKKQLNEDRENSSIKNYDAEREAAAKKEEDNRLKFKNSVIKLGNFLTAKIPNTLETQELATPNLLKLTMRCDLTNSTIKDSGEIAPDSRKAINEIFNGINLIAFQDGGATPPILGFESNMRWLKIFKEANIIENDRIPCVIIGDRELIAYYLYGGRFKGINEPGYSFNDEDVIGKILTSSRYMSILQKYSRKKTNSSFNESLFVDEFSLLNQSSDGPDVSMADILGLIKKDFSKTEQPIFINNFRNANVLSYSYRNSDNYMSMASQAVRDNRLKYLYKTLDDKQKNELLKKFNLTGENVLELSKSYFGEAMGSLGKNIDEVDPELIQKISLDDSKNIQEAIKTGKFYDEDSKAEGSKSKWESNEAYSKISKGFNKTNKDLAETLKGLVMSHSSEGVSILNLVIQHKLKGSLPEVRETDLAALSELIILLNVSENAGSRAAVEVIPGVNMPGTGFILSRLHEYGKKFSTSITLKTLPFFHLSNFNTINKKCMFLSKRIQTIGRATRDVVFDFFSGEYVILGFKHVITTSQCYSEFLLSKVGTSDETKSIYKKRKTREQSLRTGISAVSVETANIDMKR